LPVIWVPHSGSPAERAPFVAAFRQGLKETGYVEGQTVAIEHRLQRLRGWDNGLEQISGPLEFVQRLHRADVRRRAMIALMGDGKPALQIASAVPLNSAYVPSTSSN
jgi:hypothetical protein